MRVFVYYNLHKKLWSVKSLESLTKGLVIAHRKELVLRNVKPKVSEAGRQRVIRERKKNVHAGLVGEWDFDHDVVSFTGDKITYNPYRYNTFVFADSEEPFEYADMAYLGNKEVHIL